jgi:cell division protein FtsW
LESVGKRPTDMVLLMTQVLLVGMGLAVLFSASTYRAERLFDDPYYFVKRQLVWIALGAAAAFVVSQMTMSLLRRATPLILGSALILMLLTFVPAIGRPLMGARRWLLVFGVSFEPSELVKPAVVLYLAAILSKKQDRIDDALNTLLPPFLVVCVFVFLIYLQNDFSTAFFVLFVALFMFLVARVRVLYFFMLSLLAVPLAALLTLTKAHRVERLIAFVNPLADPSGSGFQVIAGQSALIGGGFWGRGLGKGVRKLGGLPEAHSDFIFAVLGEEAGFLGALFVLGLFLLLAWRGYGVALRSDDNYSRYLAFGLTTCIVLQAFLNIAVVTGLVPATGIPLPFFSAGGSSMLVTLIMSGILLNLARRLPRQMPRSEGSWRYERGV